MALLRQCDRCHADLPLDLGAVDTYNKTIKNDMFMVLLASSDRTSLDPMRSADYSRHDLCAECLAALRTWLTTPPPATTGPKPRAIRLRK